MAYVMIAELNGVVPTVDILNDPPVWLSGIEIPDENWHGMLNWQANNGFSLKDYVCHESIKGNVAR